MNLFYRVFRGVSFACDAETVHRWVLKCLSHSPFFPSAFFQLPRPGRHFCTAVGSLTWPFPVGLAAGLDKHAEAIDFFSRLPFGAVEVGSVTPRRQGGNARPRLWRLVPEASLRNAMGFNSIGAEGVAQNIARSRRNGKILGVNLGKNRDTRDRDVPEDYRLLYQKFSPLADYLVVNVSSPNTPGLRSFQRADRLEQILRTLSEQPTGCPLFLKISPDLEEEDLDGVVELAKKYSLQGIVATNTASMPEMGKGGISGRLIRQRARRMREMVLARLRECPQMETIGVGGIDSMDDLLDFWSKGGKAVQIYTAFIYRGPALLLRIARGIEEAQKRSGAADMGELFEFLSRS